MQKGFLSHCGNKVWYCLLGIAYILCPSELCSCFPMTLTTKPCNSQWNSPTIQSISNMVTQSPLVWHGSWRDHLFDSAFWNNPWWSWHHEHLHTLEGFSNHNISTARAACQLQAMLRHPSNADFINMVCLNFIKNCLSLLVMHATPVTSLVVISLLPGARLPGTNLNLSLQALSKYHCS